MSPLELSFTFFIAWFTVIFAVLPWGNRPDDEAQHSQSMGAPAKPRLWVKAAVTTVLAVLITAIAHVIALSGLVSFRG